MSFKNFILLYFSLHTVIFVLSQTLNDTVKLKEVDIIDKRVIKQSAYKRQRIDSIILARKLNTNLSGLLLEHSSVFMKSYGAGSLASPSFRGTCANHTQVFWNGIDLNSPMNGQFDFSLIPVGLIENLTVNYGATSLLNNSGSFGGNILLQSKPNWNNQLHFVLQQTIASFNNFNTFYDVKLGDEKFQSNTKIMYIWGKNDFTFKNIYLPEEPVQKLQNAELEQNGIIQEFFGKINKKNILSARIWYSQSNRNITPVITATNTGGIEKQIDNAFRTLLEWEYLSKTDKTNDNVFKLTTHTAYTYDYNSYFNDLIDIHANHYVKSIKNQILATKRYNSWEIESGVNFSRIEVKSDNYDEIKTRNIAAVYSYLDFKVFPSLNLSFVARQEYIDSIFTPFLPSAGIKFKPIKKSDFYIKSNCSKNYRYPTFNDLYWQPGGNPGLKPEKNYSAELGISYKRNSLTGGLTMEIEISSYYSQIYNMIVWTPSKFGYWTAQNLKEVLTKGVEFSLCIKYALGDFNFSLQNNYNYCSSTNQKQASELDFSAGKQLIYVPRHFFNSTLNIERKSFYFTINESYIGKRYITSDNEIWIPAYALTNLNFGRTINFNLYSISLQFQVNNLFNEQYQAIAYRPMPGRNFAISLKLELKK